MDEIERLMTYAVEAEAALSLYVVGQQVSLPEDRRRVQSLCEDMRDCIGRLREWRKYAIDPMII